MSTITMEAVELRLDRLERENCRLRWIAATAALVALAGGGLALLGHGRGGGEVVAERVVIRDKEGRLRGTFGIDRSGLPGLKLFDRRGLEQIALEIPSDGLSTLTFSDRGTSRVLLDASTTGASALRLIDEADQSDAALFITPKGTAGLRVTNGTKAEVLGPQPDASPSTAPPDPSSEPHPLPAARSITLAPRPSRVLASSTARLAK